MSCNIFQLNISRSKYRWGNIQYITGVSLQEIICCNVWHVPLNIFASEYVQLKIFFSSLLQNVHSKGIFVLSIEAIVGASITFVEFLDFLAHGAFFIALAQSITIDVIIIKSLQQFN